jgi:flagellin-specific chaperone FliS
MSTYRSAAQAYQTGRTLGAHPIDLIVMGYDEALAGFHEEDADRTTRALLALKGSLRPDQHISLATHLRHIYDHCLYLVHKKDFRRGAQLLAEIRDAWREARQGRPAEYAVQVELS